MIWEKHGKKCKYKAKGEKRIHKSKWEEIKK